MGSMQTAEITGGVTAMSQVPEELATVIPDGEQHLELVKVEMVPAEPGVGEFAVREPAESVDYRHAGDVPDTYPGAQADWIADYVGYVGLDLDEGHRLLKSLDREAADWRAHFDERSADTSRQYDRYLGSTRPNANEKQATFWMIIRGIERARDAQLARIERARADVNARYNSNEVHKRATAFTNEQHAKRVNFQIPGVLTSGEEVDDDMVPEFYVVQPGELDKALNPDFYGIRGIIQHLQATFDARHYIASAYVYSPQTRAVFSILARTTPYNVPDWLQRAGETFVNRWNMHAQELGDLQDKVGK